MYFHVYKKIYYDTAGQHILTVLVSFESKVIKQIYGIFSLNSIHAFSSYKGFKKLQDFFDNF